MLQMAASSPDRGRARRLHSECSVHSEREERRRVRSDNAEPDGKEKLVDELVPAKLHCYPALVQLNCWCQSHELSVKRTTMIVVNEKE